MRAYEGVAFRPIPQNIQQNVIKKCVCKTKRLFLKVKQKIMQIAIVVKMTKH